MISEADFELLGDERVSGLRLGHCNVLCCFLYSTLSLFTYSFRCVNGFSPFTPRVSYGNI